MSRAAPESDRSLASVGDAYEASLSSYRPVSGLAVGGLFAGLASLVAWWHPLFLAVALAAVAWNVLALWRMARAPELIGRSLAAIGLALALANGVGALSLVTSRQWFLRSEAQRLGGLWLADVAAGELASAHQQTLDQPLRQADGGDLWEYYARSPAARDQLEKFADKPAVKSLATLGEQATIRRLWCDAASRVGQDYEVVNTYAVSYDEAGQRKSFLVLLNYRCSPRSDGPSRWQLLSGSLVDMPPKAWQPPARKQ